MKKLLLFLIILSFFNACQSAKDALTLKKKSSADEFLVEKKSPLVLPPVFGELPLPGEKLEKKKGSKRANITKKSSSPATRPGTQTCRLTRFARILAHKFAPLI